MPAISVTQGRPTRRRSPIVDILRYAIVGGLVLGCADILFAYLFWKGQGVTIPEVFQSIARGIYGKQSPSLGTTSVVVGAICHFFIAICMVLAWLEFVSHNPAFNKKWMAWGLLYGLMLYAFMNFILLPLTPVGMPKFGNPEWIESSVFMHMVFGVWCAFCGSRYLARR